MALNDSWSNLRSPYTLLMKRDKMEYFNCQQCAPVEQEDMNRVDPPSCLKALRLSVWWTVYFVGQFQKASLKLVSSQEFYDKFILLSHLRSTFYLHNYTHMYIYVW